MSALGSEPRLIPLRARDGSVRAYAIVDADDYDRLTTRRWKLTAKGYAQREECVDGKWRSERMHRLVLGLERGDVREGDHINGNRLDNRRENLRIVPASAQQQNVRRRPGLRGVRRAASGRWTARVRQQHLGTFDTYDEATKVAQSARAELLPFAMD